ncbi:MAG TPA: ABC transporter ATP-binding protein [Anaerolineae bacterium]|nr:ABC transporter ATP-binding protein [Anaerolineae bacterium]HIQ04958.1 ABC transporter ATP-binding protein [Anaerolineae bacterium]
MKGPPLVQLVGVTRTYHLGAVEVQALRGIDLEISPGEFTALRGRSGSGKTTLLNVIGGLDRPTSGQVYLDGRRLDELSERELTLVRRHLVGYVFQSFALLPNFSAYENVELMLRLAEVPRRERDERTREVLALVGLEDRMHHRPYELSGGQQQRVAIAKALANRPQLILADEPTGELDSATGRQILSLFRRIVEEQQITVIVATHDPVADEYVQRVLYLQDGQLSGKPS